MTIENHASFDSSLVPTQVINSAGCPIYVNRAWQDLWGVSDIAVREVVLAKYNILTDPLMSELGIRDHILEAFAGKIVEPFPVPYEPNKFGYPGRSRWVLAKLEPKLDPTGALNSVVVTFRDLTPEREDVWSDSMSPELSKNIETSAKGAVIRGTTIRPLTIFRLLKLDNVSIDIIRDRFPDLSLEQFEDAVKYCQALGSSD